MLKILMQNKINIKVDISGARGFIGSNLYDYLLKKNNYNINKRQNFFFFSSYKNIDLNDSLLIHLSEKSDRNFVNNLDNNYIDKNKNFVSEIVKHYKKVIYLSSSAVYGYNGTKPYSEEDKTYQFDLYTKNKLTIEKIILKNNGLVIRLSNVLGNNKKKNIINDIISQINKNKIILKNIDTTIDFIDIRDVTKVVDECILNNLKGIYNLGSGNGIKTIDLVKKILKINNKNNKEIIQRDNVSRKTFNVLNVNKIKKELNWKPKYDLEQSILNYAK